MNRELLKYLRVATIAGLAIIGGGCRNSVLHKEGAAHVAREAVTPITRSLDKLPDKLIEELRLEELTYELKELVKTTRDGVKTGEKTVEQLSASLKEITLLAGDIRVLVNNLEETRGESTELIKTARELVGHMNNLMPEVTALVSSVNSLVGDTKDKLTTGTTESTWMKILPYFIWGIGILVVVLILLTIFKKRKDK